MLMTFEMIERVIAQCAADHECDPSEVMVFEVKPNERFDPEWRPFNEVCPNREGNWLEKWEKFNFEGNATHTVDCIYPNPHAPYARALYGVNVIKNKIEIWMD